MPTILGAEAFVPDPIPREVPISEATASLLGEADNAIGRLSGTTARLLNPYLVGSPLLRREAILSSKIEGTITSPEQLVLLEAAESKGTPPPAAPDRDTQEVLNYVKAMIYGLNRLRELPICLRLLTEIHGQLLSGVRGEEERPGEFRTSQNHIGRYKTEPIEQARYVPPPVVQMHELLADLEKYLHEPSATPLLIRLALVHYQFEAVHPFRDGNGRIGRLLVPLLLCEKRRMPQPLLYVSSFFEENNDAYVDLLLRVSLHGEWKEWIEFFLEAIRASAEESIETSERLIALRDSYRSRLQSARASSLSQKLIDELFRYPTITIKAASSLLGIGVASAAVHVERLQAEGILEEITGGRRNRIFVARQILAAEHKPRAAAAAATSPT